MHNIRSAWISCFGVILILLVGVIALGISNTEISENNNALIEELNKVNDKLIKSQDELNKIQSELNNVNENLSSTSNELLNIQKSLNDEISKTATLQAELETANTIIESLKSEEYMASLTVTDYEINMIAQTVWGEGRGLDALEKSGIIWCILNRVDAGYGTIAEVITAPGQFHGYSSSYPVDAEIRALVEDVIIRWKAEKICSGNFGRTLPSEYLFFHGDGKHNYFRDAYDGNYNTWDWNCWNPYE